MVRHFKSVNKILWLHGRFVLLVTVLQVLNKQDQKWPLVLISIQKCYCVWMETIGFS